MAHRSSALVRGLSILALGGLSLLAPVTASAFTQVHSATLGCGSLTATGVATTPYVTLFVNTGAPATWTIVPVVGGQFVAAVHSFPGVSAGTPVNYQVWGSLNDTWVNVGDAGYWDSEPFFNRDAPCGTTYTLTPPSPVPATTPAGLALLAGLTLLAAALVRRRLRA